MTRIWLAPRRARTGAALLALLPALPACSDDPTGNEGPPPVRGVVVLNAYGGQEGLTVLADTGTASARIGFTTATRRYDGGGFTMRNDTVLTASSKGAGDLLFVTDLRTGALTTYQMPAGSNPNLARFIAGPTGGTNVGVTLREDDEIGLLRVGEGSSGQVTVIGNAGACPTDLFRHGGAIWVVASNVACATSTYQVLGNSSLVSIPDNVATRGGFTLGANVRRAQRVEVVGDVAYVFALGNSGFDGTLVLPAAVVKVDLKAERVAQTLFLPSTATEKPFGSAMRLGADGKLYVTAYTKAPDDFGDQRVFTIDPATMTFTGTTESGQQYRLLRKTGGAAPNCSAATADAEGKLYCIEVGAASATTLYVFAPDGTQLRAAPAGQGGVDVDLRL